MHHEHPETETETAPTRPVVERLVDHHREFLRYVERRVGDRAAAEEILQDAFVRSLGKDGDIKDSAIGWFYRVLKNAVIDHQRRLAVATRRADRMTAELEADAALATDDEELHRIACRCVAELADTLKPEYAEALRRVEVDGVAVKDFADQVGITPSNAGVRIFRAREALRKQVARACGTCAEHGCLDCSCGSAPHATPHGAEV
ncbi:MAG: sigma-70 family RNA polymerase sigma factor [Myxococcota bacterium]